MKIIIKARAHYSNGHSEYFSKKAEVTDEEYDIIKQCAENYNEKLNTLK